MKLKHLSLLSFYSLVAFGLVSCNQDSSVTSESLKATYVDTTKDSIYGKISDFSLKNSDNLKAGDQLKFKVTPNEDFFIDKVTLNKEELSIGQDGYYTCTLKKGTNKIAATYKIDPTVDFVSKFKLNISDELFNQVMQDPPTAQSEKENALDFRKDGIEQMMTATTDPKDYFINYVDGDTTHVNTRNYGYSVKIRYLGIDTPESTSEIEEWGKTASNFNKSVLKSAKHIILEGAGVSISGEKTPATADGNQRSLAYVWYTTELEPTKDDFRCLNLEMVYNGFSFGIGSKEDMGENFYLAFDKANKSAEANKRHIYSNEKDSNYYYGDPVPLTLKEIYDTSKNGPTSSPYKDQKTLYSIEGYVSRKMETGFYFQDKASYDQSNGLPEAYGMYVFTYTENPIKVGDKVKVVGVLSDYGGSYQMQGVSYHTLNPDQKRDTLILESGNEIKPIKVTQEQFLSKGYNNVLVEITDTMYAFNATSTYNGVASDKGEGGTEEINKYNTKYPFYNTNNKIIFYADKNSNATENTKGVRFVSTEEMLFDYKGEYGRSYKFFVGGSSLYNYHGAEYANTNNDNPYKDDTITRSYTKKTLKVICISQNYVSTSGKTTSYTATLVSKADVTFGTY